MGQSDFILITLARTIFSTINYASLPFRYLDCFLEHPSGSLILMKIIDKWDRND